jgi:hypothetical protein
VIDEGQGIVGNIYVPKGKEIPKQVLIKLRVKEKTNIDIGES